LLNFSSINKAIQYLSDYTGNRIIIAKTYIDNKKYYQIIPEIKTIKIETIKRLNSFEILTVSSKTAEHYKKYLNEPIEVSIFSDGEMKISDGHHRVATAKKLGIKNLPVILQAINTPGKYINKLIQEQNNFN